MDGASKFVRGDAVAGLLILVINLIGGIIIGIAEHHLSFMNAAHTFSILTIGDGLVAQIPSLLLSISAAIMVTRVSNEADVSKQTLLQLFGNQRPIFLSSCILTVLAVIPQMPHLSLLMFATIGLIMSYFLASNKQEIVAHAGKQLDVRDNRSGDELVDLSWDDVASCDRVALEIGYGLIQLVGAKREGQLISRIKGIRKKLSQKLGFLIPTIHIKDNFTLPPNVYRIYLKGVQVAEAQVYSDKLLAITAGNIQQSLPGILDKDPTFGLDCYWINENQKQHAETLGYTVVDASTVIATHLNQIIYTNAGYILGYEEVQQLINKLLNTDPKLAEILTSTANGVPTTVIFTVLQKLLTSEIPIVDFATIAETMIEQWSRVKDQEVLTSTVRIALKQMIVYNICGSSLELPVAVLNNDLTQILLKSVQLNQSINEKMIVVDPGLADRIFAQLLAYVKKCETNVLPVIFLVHDELRVLIERLFKANLPNVHFLSFAEIPNNKQIKIVERIG
nr:FHIPEP family type III secretion protein [Legionella norrlandica]